MHLLIVQMFGNQIIGLIYQQMKSINIYILKGVETISYIGFDVPTVNRSFNLLHLCLHTCRPTDTIGQGNVRHVCEQGFKGC